MIMTSTFNDCTCTKLIMYGCTMTCIDYITYKDMSLILTMIHIKLIKLNTVIKLIDTYRYHGGMDDDSETAVAVRWQSELAPLPPYRYPGRPPGATGA